MYLYKDFNSQFYGIYTCSCYQTKQYLNHLQQLKHFFILLREIRLNQRRPLRLYKK